MSPISRKAELPMYADDSYYYGYNVNKDKSVKDLVNKLKKVITWLKESGLKVNEDKTEIVIFHKSNCNCVSVNINGKLIKSKKSLKVLGVIFDSKMNWSVQVEHSLNETRKAMHALKQIRKFFSQDELIILATSFLYSKLFYAAETWLLPTLNECLFSKLYSQSGMILKIVNPNLTYAESHKLFKRATPKQFCMYLTSLNLFDLFTTESPAGEWINLNFNVLQSSRANTMIFTSNNALNVGFNRISNRFSCLNGKILPDILNVTRDTYKVHMKKCFLSLS
jgi:hypothetical protein